MSIFNPKSAIRILLLSVFFSVIAGTKALPQNVSAIVAGIQRRYASVQTVKGSFRQNYRAPGIHQEESGEFWLKRPGLMRWEYREPLEQLFVADGRQAFLYVPEDRQVTVRPLTAADLRNTPLDLLLGTGKIEANFVVSPETQSKPKLEGTIVLRLTPRGQSDYSFLLLEVDRQNFEIRRILIRESGGSTSEFHLSNMVLNARVDSKLFQFKTPKGVEEIRLDDGR